MPVSALCTVSADRMTIGHRVSRFTLKSSRAVRKLFPWASRLVRVDGVWVAYEAAEDALEEHGVMGELASGSDHGFGRRKRLLSSEWPTVDERRGDL